MLAAQRHGTRAAHLFMAGQQTEMLQRELVAWLDEAEFGTGFASSKASLPPFNIPPGMAEKILPGTLGYSACRGLERKRVEPRRPAP